MKRYYGSMAIEMLVMGVEECIKNTRELIDDARLLFSRGRIARSMYILLSAEQEIGKVYIFSEMAQIPFDNKSMWKESWDLVYGHREKVVTSQMFGEDRDLAPTFSSLAHKARDYYLNTNASLAFPSRIGTTERGSRITGGLLFNYNNWPNRTIKREG